MRTENKTEIITKAQEVVSEIHDIKAEIDNTIAEMMEMEVGIPDIKGDKSFMQTDAKLMEALLMITGADRLKENAKDILAKTQEIAKDTQGITTKLDDDAAEAIIKANEMMMAGANELLKGTKGMLLKARDSLADAKEMMTIAENKDGSKMRFTCADKGWLI